MEEILRMARELGGAIARHKGYSDLREAEEAVKVDAEASALVKDFDQHQERLLNLTREQKPIEPEDKRAMADLQQRLMSHGSLKRLQAAQVEFRHLMDRMNGAIHEGLEPAGSGEPPD